MKIPVKHITIKAEIPKGVAIGDLSRKYPEINFNLTNGHWISSNERTLYITCNEWKKEYFLFLKKHPSVKNIEKIGNVTKIHIMCDLLSKFDQKEMTIIYPTSLKGGMHRIEFLINQKQLNALKRGLQNVEVLKITDSYRSEVTLTERQETILWKAYSLGYFKYPRDITLTDLAKLLKISKATLSQTLRTVENRAIKLILEK